MEYFQIRSFLKFQSQKSDKPGHPPWIKVWHHLRDTYEFDRLSDRQRWHLVGLLLVAGRCKNKIPRDTKWLRREIPVKGRLYLDALKHWIEPYQQVTEEKLQPIREEKIREEVLPAVAPAPAGARKVSGDDGEVLRCFNEYHQGTLGMPYLSQVGRDRRSLRQPLKVYGKPVLLEMVSAFFNEIGRTQRNEPDAYVGKARPDIPNFVRVIPALIRDWSFDSKPRVAGGKE